MSHTLPLLEIQFYYLLIVFNKKHLFILFKDISLLNARCLTIFHMSQLIKNINIGRALPQKDHRF